MNLRFLKTIIAISKHPNLVSAADSLGLSHSAVSLQVKTLEKELQIMILDRSTRPPSLTDEGFVLVEQAKRIVSITDDIQFLLRGKNLLGRVMIGAVPSTVSGIVAPALASLKKQHPNLQVELYIGLSGPLIQKVKERDLDVVIATEPPELGEELQVRTLCHEPYNLVVSNGQDDLDLKDLLAARPFIWFDRRSWLSRQVEMFLRAEKFQVNAAMEVDSIEAVECLVAHDLGVSILPRRIAEPDRQDLRYVPIEIDGFSRRVAMISHRRSPRSKVSDSLFETIQANIASITGSQPLL